MSTFKDKTEKLNFLLELISKKQTGNAEELSKRICVSMRTFFRYLDDLRAMGYKISYCLQRETYHFIGKDENEKKHLIPKNWQRCDSIWQ